MSCHWADCPNARHLPFPSRLSRSHLVHVDRCALTQFRRPLLAERHQCACATFRELAATTQPAISATTSHAGGGRQPAGPCLPLHLCWSSAESQSTCAACGKLIPAPHTSTQQAACSGGGNRSGAVAARAPGGCGDCCGPEWRHGCAALGAARCRLGRGAGGVSPCAACTDSQPRLPLQATHCSSCSSKAACPLLPAALQGGCAAVHLLQPAGIHHCRHAGTPRQARRRPRAAGARRLHFANLAALAVTGHWHSHR